MADYKPVKIIRGNPEKKNIAFGFNAYAKTICKMMANRGNILRIGLLFYKTM